MAQTDNQDAAEPGNQPISAEATLPPGGAAPGGTTLDASGTGAGGRDVWRAALLILVAAWGAYYNSYVCQFICDDGRAIRTNASIHHLWPLGPVLNPPSQLGQTVGGRPLLNLSLAINYALHGYSVVGYHAANLAIHVLAALVLLGILRRTFLLPPLRDRFGPFALALATAATLLWTVHPVQTESVTYISQRAESMMGLFYLLTLYCVIRAAQADDWAWSLAAVGACALGMASKEVMVTAPVIVLLYDRTFLSGSFAAALRKRWGLYAGLAACWGVLACVMAMAGNRGGTAGFESHEIMLDWRSYALTEFGAVLHYLRVAFWPDALCLYWYGCPAAKTLGQILPGAVAVGAIAVATVRGLTGGRKWGFLGAWFLVILVPTSSVVPILSPIFEHRIYLSLAAPMTLVVIAGFLLWQRLLRDKGWFAGESVKEQWFVPRVAVVVVAVLLAFLATRRNLVYRSGTTVSQDLAAKSALWEDESEERPMHSKIHNDLGLSLAGSGTPELALECFRRAARLDPTNDQAYLNLGAMLYKQGQTPEAIRQFRQAIAINPRNVTAHANLGSVLCKQGNVEDGIGLLRQAVRLDADDVKARNALGAALCTYGSMDEGVAELRRVIASHPDNADAHANMGLALARQGKPDQAIEQYRKALAANPRLPAVYKSLMDLLVKSGRMYEAMELKNEAQNALGPPDAP